MSDEKKLSDDLNEMLGDAKDEVRKAAEKVEKKAGEFAEEAKEALGNAKEKATEFAGEAKEKAEEFAGDAKEVLSEGKNVAIIAHITIIGWVIALIMNNPKTELGSYYIRQMLGLIIVGFVSSFIPFVNLIIGIVLLVFWIMSLVGALGGQKKPIPLLGEQFQDWFKSL